MTSILCHRCGGDLPGGDLRGFCPTCGAPQLRFDALKSEDAGESTGTEPPPHPQDIEWPLGMRCAAAVAGGSAIVSAAAFALPALGLPSLLLLSGGSFLTVGLYRRRSPMALMTPGVGARLGLSTGVLLTATLAIALAGMLLLARFHAHSMGAFDAQWSAQVQDLLERTQSGSPVPPDAARQMMSPEFRAGSMLAGLAMLASFLLAISAGTGAFAGSIAVRQNPKL